MNKIIIPLFALATTACGTDDHNTYAVMVRGQLASSDLATAQAAHDMIASGGQADATAKGDISHDVLLGTTMLDSIDHEFFAFDQWTDREAMKKYYADPKIAQGFATLFAQPPTLEYFVLASDWVGWGDMTSGDAYSPYYFHLALGDLANEDTAANQAAHNMVASGGKDPSIPAGNVAHIVFLGLDNPRRFNAIDIWGSGNNIEAFYTNPQFVQAFAPLFSSVTQPVYASTTWHQW